MEPGSGRTIDDSLWEEAHADLPVIAFAVHSGTEVRDEVAALLAIGEPERRREEDPYSDVWTTVAPTRVAVRRSRFEVDLNRTRADAVYAEDGEAWGLRIWKSKPPSRLVEQSLLEHDRFYERAHALLTGMSRRFPQFLVLDVHSYNHRRAGRYGPYADPEENPEINIGTGHIDRARWGGVTDAFIQSLRGFNFLGRRLDVRENVKFQGGYFPRWVHTNFGEVACVLAVEVKKFFMDEWTGDLHFETFDAVRRALGQALPPVAEVLRPKPQ